MWKEYKCAGYNYIKEKQEILDKCQQINMFNSLKISII